MSRCFASYVSQMGTKITGKGSTLSFPALTYDYSVIIRGDFSNSNVTFQNCQLLLPFGNESVLLFPMMYVTKKFRSNMVLE